MCRWIYISFIGYKMHLVSANKHGKMILFDIEELYMENNNKLLNIEVWQVFKNNYIVTKYLILHWNSSHLHILLILIYVKYLGLGIPVNYIRYICFSETLASKTSVVGSHQITFHSPLTVQSYGNS